MRPAPSLISLVSRRILLFATLASLLQIGVVFADYWFDDEELGRLMVERETTRIHEDFLAARAQGSVFPGAALAERYGLDGYGLGGSEPGYFLRVRDAAGAVVYSNCEAACARRFFFTDGEAQTFWLRVVTPGRPLTIAGGRGFGVSGGTGTEERLVVEFATAGDPDRLVNGVLLNEMIDHMVVPMGLMLFLVIGATLLSIRRALRSVALAAAAADRIDPRATAARLPVEGMPREIARLADAVNRAFVRVAALIRSQKIFAASVAHELRTPLAVLRLELEQIEDPRARAAERNLDDLAHTLEQLTALARLDAVEEGAFVRRGLAASVRTAVEGIAPLVYREGKALDFDERCNPEVRTLPGLIETLVRNLVGNAVKHTPPGTLIHVAVEPPARLRVEDNGGGFVMPGDLDRVELGIVKASGALGLGLKIVERICALHGATLTVEGRSGAGARIVIAFPLAGPPNVT